MTMITRWNPFREAEQMQNTLNRLFQNWDVSRFNTDEFTTTGSFLPAVDVYEDEHSYKLSFEIPGVNEKDIDIRLENNTLTVRGERKFEKEMKEENFHRVERRYGSFARSFTLPNTIDADKVSADYREGVLTVVLAKKAEAKPKQIKVGLGKSLESGKAA
jgi:HSP20 family protein